MKYILLILVFYQATLFGQDTILFLSGECLPVKSWEIDKKENIISYTTLKGKEKEAELDFIFSVISEDNSETIIFEESFIEQHLFEVEQMRSFVMGARQAHLRYNTTWPSVAAFSVGAGSVVALSFTPIPLFYSPLIPALYTGIYGTINPSEKRIIKKNPEHGHNLYFVKGYKEVAKQKRTNNSVKGAICGLGAMFITAIIISIAN